MEAVRDYAEVLQAEAEELALVTNSKMFSTAPTAAPVLKALQVAGQDGSSTLPASTSTKGPCRYWKPMRVANGVRLALFSMTWKECVAGVGHVGAQITSKRIVLTKQLWVASTAAIPKRREGSVRSRKR